MPEGKFEPDPDDEDFCDETGEYDPDDYEIPEALREAWAELDAEEAAAANAEEAAESE